MKKVYVNCFTVAVFCIYVLKNSIVSAQSDGGLISKLMMMMMKNRRRTYVPFPIPLNPISYSSIIPLNYPTTLPIGYSNYRSNLINSLGNNGHLGPLGGIGSFSLGGLGTLPFLSSLRSDTKFLSRSSPIYEPTVASSSIMPSYTVVAPSTQPASTNSYLIPNAAPVNNALATNPLITTLNNLLSSTALAQPNIVTSSTNQSPAISHPLLSANPSNAISNTNSLTLPNFTPLINNAHLSNSHLFNSQSFSGVTNPTLLSASSNQAFVNNSSATTYSNTLSNSNDLMDKTMTGSQGELIKHELKEHHLNNIRIQYLKSLRDHLIKDQKLKEQYLKELTKKSSSVVYPYLDMYEELGNKK